MMIQRRAIATGIKTRISCHSFRVTGIPTYLHNGGKLEVAQQMTGHESGRTTGLYDRANDSVALDEVEGCIKSSLNRPRITKHHSQASPATSVHGPSKCKCHRRHCPIPSPSPDCNRPGWAAREETYAWL